MAQAAVRDASQDPTSVAAFATAAPQPEIAGGAGLTSEQVRKTLLPYQFLEFGVSSPAGKTLVAIFRSKATGTYVAGAMGAAIPTTSHQIQHDAISLKKMMTAMDRDPGIPKEFKEMVRMVHLYLTDGLFLANVAQSPNAQNFGKHMRRFCTEAVRNTFRRDCVPPDQRPRPR